MPSYVVLDTVKCSPSDIFYCEQAIWEGTPFRKDWENYGFQGTTFPITFSKAQHTPFARSDWKELKKNKSSKFVSMHLIPARVSEWVNSTDIASPESVVKISTDKLSSSSLKDFRADWAKFLNGRTKLTWQELHEKAAQMQIQFASLIENSWG